MNEIEKKNSRGLRQTLGFKKDETQTTLELWQAHLRALRRASSNTSGSIEVCETSEQTNSSTTVNMPDNIPTP